MFLNKMNKFVYRDFGVSLKSRYIKNKKKKHCCSEVLFSTVQDQDKGEREGRNIW